MAIVQRGRTKRTQVLPGLGITLGVTVTFLSLMVLLPLSTLVWKASGGGWSAFRATVTDPEALAAYRLSFGAALAAALVNTVFGVLIAWVLARYRFPGRRVVDALVDLPFALPTAVAGISLASIYSQNGLVGRLFAPGALLGRHFGPEGLPIAYTPLGIVIALIFVGLPFVVRTVQPILQDRDREIEEAASSLGASPLQILWKVILPPILPAAVTGFSLAFARALGEYGSVVFISGNMPMKTEIAPLLIMSKLENFDYAGATSIAVVMLGASFAILLFINLLQRVGAHRFRGEGTH